MDGDLKSLRVLEVSLKKAGFEVATATQGSEALGALQAALPDLIISDTDLDGMDGFDLCRQIKAKPEWAKIPFLFVSGRKSIEDKIRGLELGVEDYLTKPIYIKEIGIRVRTALQRAERERLESRREGRTKFAGDLADIGVVDLVQTIDLNRKSGIVHIVNRDGRRGAIFFREGRVIDAEVGRRSGTEAMYRLFSWSDGRFEVEFKPIRRRDVIDLPSAALLMEGMRRLDEWTRLLEKLPALDSVVEVDVRVLAEQLADLPDEMNGILRLCDGTHSLLAVVDDSDYPDLEALTVVSKLFGLGIIYAREPASGRGEAEPSSELARWLAEGNAEDGTVADEASAARQFVTDADRSTKGAAGAPRVTTDDARPSSEREGGKTLKTFSLDVASLSPDTPPPGRGEAGATAEPDKVASRPKLTGNTLRLPAALPEQHSAPSYPASSAGPPPADDRPAEAASPLEASAVVEHSWREPADLPVAPLTPPAAVSAPPAIGAAVDAAGPSAKPDTLRGFPIPEGLAQSDQARPARTSAVSDDGRPPRTTIEYAPTERDVAPSAANPAGEPARETDWGGWGQGTDGERMTESELSQAATSHAEVGANRPELPVAGASRQESAPSVTEIRHGHERVSDEEHQIQPADQAPMPAEETPASSPSPDGEPIKARPTIDKLDGDLVPHERRWPLFVVGLVLLVAGGLFALRIGPTGSRSPPSPRAESPAATSPKASISSAIDADPAAINRAPSQLVDQVSRPPPIVTPVAAEKLVAVSADVRAKLAAGQEPGGQPRLAANGTPILAPDAGQTGAPALGPATPGIAELREHCRKADAGGNGRPAAVLAACRPAIEAEPQAADIMVILARAELDRGRAGEARSWAKKALEVNPDLADAYVVLGGAEQEAENPEAAKAAYKRYLELAPSGRHAHELRTILDSL